MSKQIKLLLNKFFRDKKGNIVIGQSPNIPIIGWSIFMLTSIIVPSGTLKTGFSMLSSAFLFLWAYLELTQGVNKFRQLLGLVVILIVITSYFL